MRKADASSRSRALFGMTLALLLVVLAPSARAAGCLACHAGIETIRDPDSEMMKAIIDKGLAAGDPAGCVVCHGGDPQATEARRAHRGPNFYPDPGSPWINQQTCGRCHEEQVRVQWQGLMMTEAGKIQGIAWSAGAQTGYEHRWGNYEVASLPEQEQLGSSTYKAWRRKLARREPRAFPDKMTPPPPAPLDPQDVVADPRRAAFTYLRSECQRCHLAVRGRQTRGDYRGMGCSACHIPYSNEGFYEGEDPTIPRDERGHLLVHRIQSGRKAKVEVHGQLYSGIPVETCTTCHDRGKRIGVSYQGLMESAYHSPWGDAGDDQPGLHTKHYIALTEDIHYRKGMLCQDCHTSIDVHGDGALAGANLGQVEIECSDCHGTPEHLPWELPIGYGDEFGVRLDPAPRGVALAIPPWQQKGTRYPVEDGYLLSARGNPLGNVVRRGEMVVVHTAAGADLQLEPLAKKAREGTLSIAARVAMVAIGRHIDRMECYSCHADWVPQCYGCHVKVDYSTPSRGADWIARGAARQLPGRAAEAREDPHSFPIPGKVTEQRSYLRWEEPALGVNGEGRVTPIAPGCQVSYTVIGADGESVIRNKIFRSPGGSEGAGSEGQITSDMSPTTPHTTGDRARTCESCHLSEKAAGYGILGGRVQRPWDEDLVIDLATAEGKVLPSQTRVQIAAIEGLTRDWSAVLDSEGHQTQTVGHHFSGSRPLDSQQRARLDRRGICLSCHEEIPAGSLAVDVLHHVASVTGQLPATAAEHGVLLRKVLLTAGWFQVGVFPLALLVCAAWWWRRRRRTRSG